MTSNRTLKRLIRKHMEETGLCYLDAKRSFEAKEALELAIDLSRANEPRFGQVIAVAGARGGVGKTTVAMGLASYLAKSSEAAVERGLKDRLGQRVDRPLKVLLLDFDLRDGQVGYFTGVYEPTMMDIQRSGVSTKTIDRAKIFNRGLGVDVLLAPRSGRGADGLTHEFSEELLTALRSLYDYIIIDTPANRLNPLMREVVYPQADIVLFLAEPLSRSLQEMADQITIVSGPVDEDGLGIPKQKIGIVLNKFLKDSRMTGKQIQEYAQDVPIISVFPANTRVVAHAIKVNGMELLLEDQGLNGAFERLAKSVVGFRYPLARLFSADSTAE